MCHGSSPSPPADAIDNGQNRKAIQLADKIIRKHDDLHCAKVSCVLFACVQSFALCTSKGICIICIIVIRAY